VVSLTIISLSLLLFLQPLLCVHSLIHSPAIGLPHLLHGLCLMQHVPLWHCPTCKPCLRLLTFSAVNIISVTSLSVPLPVLSLPFLILMRRTPFPLPACLKLPTHFYRRFKLKAKLPAGRLPRYTGFAPPSHTTKKPSSPTAAINCSRAACICFRRGVDIRR